MDQRYDGDGKKLSRRAFLKATSAAAAFQIVPRHVLGGPGYTAANDRLNIAGIGVGGKGHSDVSECAGENIVALCDVDRNVAARTFEKFPQAKVYSDYRVMLEKEKRIDAVLVATPDHTHAVISMTAMRMGKHVYCQKPLTHTVDEAHALAQAAREEGVATQMGNQGQASEATRVEIETIQGGLIGAVTEVHAWTDRPLRGLHEVYWPQGIGRPEGTPVVPDHLAWDLWLGPAAERPYHQAYHPFSWRGWWDFGTGALGDIGCHCLHGAFLALKLGHPDSVEATSSLVNNETYPLSSMVTYHFPARGELPPVKLVWYDGGLRPPRPAELEDGRLFGDNGILYVGTKGKMLEHVIIPESRRIEAGPPPKTLPRSPGHYREWLDACKGGPSPGSNFETAGHLTQVVLLGNVALRPELREALTKNKLEWDGVNRTFRNLPEADRFLRMPYRTGWEQV